MIAASRAFYAVLKDSLWDAAEAPDDGFQLVMHAFRGDSTNSAVWQKAKLHSMQVESAFLSDVRNLESATAIIDHLDTNVRYPDLQRVSDETAVPR